MLLRLAGALARAMLAGISPPDKLHLRSGLLLGRSWAGPRARMQVFVLGHDPQAFPATYPGLLSSASCSSSSDATQCLGRPIDSRAAVQARGGLG